MQMTTGKANESGGERLDLALVMPAYNEEDCIAGVVSSWLDTLLKQAIRFRMIVLNDGSTDRTAEVLAGAGKDPRVEIVDKPNTGHGPTILAGYARAVKAADWVFQCDSDNEISPDYFADLWAKREGYDALFGCRSLRAQPLARRIITIGSRATVRLLFGRGVVDVNVPYRLIRSSLLEQIIMQIPRNTFAPNVIISGALSQAGVRIYNQPVRWEFRRTGVVSIARWKLWKSAVRAFWQTMLCRPRVGRRGE
jgi:dolichol-phosphate mannosyltransferase